MVANPAASNTPGRGLDNRDTSGNRWRGKITGSPVGHGTPAEVFILLPRRYNSLPPVPPRLESLRMLRLTHRFEPLEPRRLLAVTAVAVEGAWRITGTRRGDVIVVEPSPEDPSVL